MKLLDAMMRRFVKTGTLRLIDADGVPHVYAARPEPGQEVGVRAGHGRQTRTYPRPWQADTSYSPAAPHVGSILSMERDETIMLVARNIEALMAERGTDAAGAQVPEATVQRAGAAIRDLSGIQARFTQRMQSAQPAEHEAITAEANGAAEAALAARGLTPDEYNNVIRLAQADQSLRERLISAARGAR